MLLLPKGKKRVNSPTNDMSSKKAKSLASEEIQDSEFKENLHVNTGATEVELEAKSGKKISPSSKPKSKKRSILYKAHKKPGTKSLSASEPAKKSTNKDKMQHLEATKKKLASPKEIHARLPSPTSSSSHSSQSARSPQVSFARSKVSEVQPSVSKASVLSSTLPSSIQVGKKFKDSDSTLTHSSAKKSPSSDKSHASFSFSTIASKSPIKLSDMRSDVRHLSYESLAQKYDALNESYERLAALRETKAEELLASYRESAEARHQASDRIIANLKEQLSKTAVEMETLKSSTQALAKRSNAKESSHMVEFMSKLTGLTASMTLDANQHAVWHVSQKSKSGKGVFEYVLFQEADSNVFQYQPVSLAAGASRKSLPANPPEFLLEEIEFDERQLSTFFHRVSHWLLG